MEPTDCRLVTASCAAVVLDDFGWCGYWRQRVAHEAFAAERGTQILELPTGQGLLIKPR